MTLALELAALLSLVTGQEPQRISSLDALQSDFRAKVEAFVNDPDARAWNVRIIETYRTWGRQAWLYGQGRTRAGEIITHAEPGRSRHEIGRAADFWTGSDSPAVAKDRANALIPAMARHGLKSLPGIGDYDHLEDS